MEKNYFEDYRVGEVFVSPGRTITETDVVLFSAFTGDWHEIHTNVEYAAGTPFKGRIAHGMLSLVTGMALLFRLGPYVVLPRSFIAFYGMDGVRFTAPVRIGDTIHCEMKVTALSEKDAKRGIIEAQSSIKNQKGETAIVFTTMIIAGRKPL
jgi:3-hydroxybutyryl-CoA dehydratase